eukprot:7841013-Alexandrium_andersonii.AAC.1
MESAAGAVEDEDVGEGDASDKKKRTLAGYETEYKRYLSLHYGDYFKTFDYFRYARKLKKKKKLDSAGCFQQFSDYMNTHCVFSDSTIKSG